MWTKAINFIETNFAERVALEQYLADKERPDPKVLTAFVPQLLDEFSSRMWSGAFREYGWEESDSDGSFVGRAKGRRTGRNASV